MKVHAGVSTANLEPPHGAQKTGSSLFLFCCMGIFARLLWDRNKNVMIVVVKVC